MTMTALANGIIADAGNAVTVAFALIGVMSLFLGLMKIAEAGGLLTMLARVVRPAMRRLFPDVPPNHPAMGAMILNISANVLGLGNAATPFGIRAMEHLNALNPFKGQASNAMVLFLAINTASVTILPTSVIALRAAAGSRDPAGILPTTLFATVCSTAIAILLSRVCQRFWPIDTRESARDRPPPHEAAHPTAETNDEGPPPPATPEPCADDAPDYPGWLSWAVLVAVLALIPLSIIFGPALTAWIIPGLVVGLLLFGAARGVRVYEAFVEGAGDGFRVAVRIIPYLVGILVAVGMLRASGALDLALTPLGRLTTPLGLPPEAIAMAMLRALSGSGAYAYLATVINDPAIGPDSYLGYLVSTIQGSTETTFYVLAVYFGAVGVRRMRHAVFVGLAADVAGVLASVIICGLLAPS